ncbi:Zinc finger X-chromosomal protein [Frankliniella fusca]|uniref:Zinc finger X-chromosomal protein n=1 Tax=Frankliniella fusca TaxID=407009 RepID=A0AAE1LB64_9NEOP|nr:Zinc finger X-chromosomal protein [Frankliniella fusca]
MEIDIKDLEGVTLLPLADGRVAYVDKSGTVFMCGLKEELLTNDFQQSLSVEGEIEESSENTDEQVEAQFLLPNIFSEQCTNLILGASESQFLTQDVGVNETEAVEIEKCEIDVEQVDELLDTSKNNCLSVLQVDDDCVEQVTVFKCRACLFTAAEKTSIVQHYAKEHLKVTQHSTFLSTPGTIPVSEEFERLAQSVVADSQDDFVEETNVPESESEQLLYVCVQCQNAFESIEICKQHMIQEHKFVSGRGKAPPKGPIHVLSDTSSGVSNVNLSSIEPVVTFTSGEVQWQSLELAEGSILVSTETPSIKTDTIEEKGDTSVTTEKKLGNSPKEQVQKVKQRARKIKCTFPSCVSKFSNDKALQTHLSCHSKDRSVKDFHCIHCDETFVRWRLCSAHLWRVHKVDVDLLTCPVCQAYKAATPLKLEIHMRTHGDLRPFRCKLCPKSFKQSAQLRNHCTSVHLDKGSTESSPRWYMEQQCPHCGKMYSNAKGLKRHIQAVHSKIKPYVCSVCGHSSACKAMLALHLRQHTGEKPHACTHCDYRTGDHNTLRRHMMRHTGERPYKCPYCTYEAIQSNCYKAHLRNRHPGESGLFSCSSCSFQTINQDAYVQHVADHQKGLVTAKEDTSTSNSGEEVEYFPGNVAAAHLVYRYLGTFLPEPGHKLPPANITDSRTSADGTTQSITIQIPSQEDPSIVVEDDESSHSFFLKGTDDDVGIDTGGITIPADPSDLGMVET